MNQSSFGLRRIISLNTPSFVFLAWNLIADPVFPEQVQSEKLSRIGPVVFAESTEHHEVGF